jgi:hypothetical protein
MRTAAIGLALFTCLDWGQTTDLRDRTFFLTHTPALQQFQEVATVIRTIADIREAAVDKDQRSVTVHASASQIAMAEWLFNELDTQTVQASVPHEYRVPGTTDDLVRLFYLTDTATVQDFQEAATLVRTIADFRRAFTYNEPRAFVVRGTAAQIGLAEWLLKELEPSPTPSTREYRMPNSNDDVVRVLHLGNTQNVQDFQNAAIAIRNTTQIQRVFTYNSPRAVALRGTADQIALAARLAKDLDHR